MKFSYSKTFGEGIWINYFYEINGTRDSENKKVWSQLFKLHKRFRGECPEIAGRARGESESIYVVYSISVVALYDKVSADAVRSAVNEALSEAEAIKYMTALWRLASKKTLGYIANIEFLPTGITCEEFVAGHSEDVSFDEETM